MHARLRLPKNVVNENVKNSGCPENAGSEQIGIFFFWTTLEEMWKSVADEETVRWRRKSQFGEQVGSLPDFFIESENFSRNPAPTEAIHNKKVPAQPTQWEPSYGEETILRIPNGYPTGIIKYPQLFFTDTYSPPFSRGSKKPTKKIQNSQRYKSFRFAFHAFPTFSGKISTFRILSPTSHTAHNMPHMIPHVMEKTWTRDKHK